MRNRHLTSHRSWPAVTQRHSTSFFRYLLPGRTGTNRQTNSDKSAYHKTPAAAATKTPSRLFTRSSSTCPLSLRWSPLCRYCTYAVYCTSFFLCLPDYFFVLKGPRANLFCRLYFTARTSRALSH